MPRMIDGRGPYPDDYIPWEPVSLYHRPVPTGWLVEREPLRLLDRIAEPCRSPDHTAQQRRTSYPTEP